MKLIVGLGNPGDEYKYTRHNIGFLALDRLVEKFNPDGPKKNFNAFYWETKINDEKVIFMKPQTYMNLSGSAVLAIKQFYKINLEDIIIIHDDKDIEFGALKIKTGGSSAGQNGIKDLINKLGSENFKRIRIGIGRDQQIDLKDWVLGKFTKQQLATINDDILVRIEEIFIHYLLKQESFNKIMSLYNAK
ncbi:aminoacyl-tRNA hydrolase [Spiroplasma eriocheiris]|uniref:Peptidyl-tRNA hydrolase n=1 Tax=Spiroplasma eriocheiris TaxID=315358 RepID=A0A0H3XKC6_9MOLU|nr:aminoacyl-tRNA hydrolase [Spiroplasma eriocheiris]AHF57383.1 peptidyl-tRNA hydrolase [Spiroplasma eriocheiris CCTCC M 207170]AKM53839.1 peptidyl-tRNA hydrolase [Spiroplasma eriocheiris]